MYKTSTTTTRKNTYTNDEYFKIVVLTSDKETSLEKSKLLTQNTNKNLLRDDILRCEYKNTSLVCYPRWEGEIPNAETKVFEGLIVFVEDEDIFQNRLLPVIRHYYKNVKPRVLVSQHEKAETWANLIQAEYVNELKTNSSKLSGKTPQDLIEILDSLDMNEFEKIESKFNEFDTDNSGSISTDEFAEIAKYLGEETSNENFKSAILAFDKNHDGMINR